MKIQTLRNLIQEEIVKVLNETIYGENAIVFHRTNVSDLVNKVYTTGFHPGGGDVYGRGFYSTYDLKSQLRASMKSYYGNVIVKFSCPTSNFFFFDWNEFKKKELCKTLKCTEKDFIKKQLDYFELKYDEYDASKLPKSGFTSDIALNFVNTIENFTKKVDGIVFTGSRDGQVLVSYDLTRIVPVSFSTDEGETWTKVDKNLAYIKRSFNTKQKTPLQRANESFETIENYAQHLKDTGVLSGTYRIVNGKIQVSGNVDLTLDDLLNGKIPFAFGKVSGDFSCSSIALTSLENCPDSVGGDFSCYNNQLTSLAGAPKSVVGGSFDCDTNRLTSLAGAPESVGGDFRCANNRLTSLAGAPESVGGGFLCYNNSLTSLAGAPKSVGRNFDCDTNSLTSLAGAPESVGGDFYCTYNSLTSLTGAPESVGGDFLCSYNSKKFTKNDVTSVCKVKGTIRV